MLAPARMPVAEGKKMENMPKKLPSWPRQQGTKLAVKMSAGKGEIVSLQEDSVAFIHQKINFQQVLFYATGISYFYCNSDWFISSQRNH